MNARMDAADGPGRPPARARPSGPTTPTLELASSNASRTATVAMMAAPPAIDCQRQRRAANPALTSKASVTIAAPANADREPEAQTVNHIRIRPETVAK